ncbi:MAG TPA: ATP-binding protein [Gemmatimonadaceae bacterium]|nr:ATP-binding protein [Gemmatimonadaceae bacterium]
MRFTKLEYGDSLGARRDSEDQVTTLADSSTDLVDRLAQLKTLQGVPRSELDWLVANGELRRFEAGDLLARKDEQVIDMFLLLSGRISAIVDRGTGRLHSLDSEAGDASGVLPFSRLGRSPVFVRAVEPTEALAIHRDRFPELIRDCPTLVAVLVHVMLDRASLFASTSWQDEKMVALGRLGAGLAHELNNPASATVRSASLLNDAIREVSAAAQALGAAQLTDEQLSRLALICKESLVPATTGVFSVTERIDREDEFATWFGEHGVALDAAASLAESGLTIDGLDRVIEIVGAEKLGVAVRWIAAEFAVLSLAKDIQRATTRIHDLVGAVKRFTYTDRAAGMAPTDIAQGLEDTIAIMGAKARDKSVAVRLEVAPSLPQVTAMGAELNQVWANLIENAIDAVGEGGLVVVSAECEADNAVVRVIDDGPGIPSDIQSRIFDIFFTTKPIGQGTGLGLDIARRIVMTHHGHIAVDTQPGRTEFCVRIPVAKPNEAERPIGALP